MNRWITDRAPTNEELDDRQTSWVIIEGQVQQATGWWLKLNWGKRADLLTAWEPKPTNEIGSKCEVSSDTPGTYDACKAFIEADSHDAMHLAFTMAKEAVAKAEVNNG